MFELKIAVTIIVTFLLLAVFLGTNPTVSGFFDSIGQKIGSLSGPVSRDIPFSLSLDRYNEMKFVSNGANMTIEGSTTAALRTGNLVTDKGITVSGFRGTGSISESQLLLDGRISKVSLPEITVAVQETINSNSTFTSLYASELEVNEIRLDETLGSLTVRNSTTTFSGSILVSAPRGSFWFYHDGTVMRIEGTASGISIPSAELNID